MFEAQDMQPWVVRVRKYLPRALGGFRFHDRLVKKMVENVTRPHIVWESIHQYVINDIFNQEPGARKWTGVPILNAVDCPCDPGCILMVTRQNLRERLRLEPDNGCLVGTYQDFLPPDISDRTVCMKIPIVTSLRRRRERRVYQRRNNENAVVVTMVLQDLADMEHALQPENTFIVLDNFDGTFFNAEYCYVVSRVIIAESVTIETTLNGTDFYEARYTSPTAVCFQVMLARVQNPVTGSLSSLKPVDHMLGLQLKRRRSYQQFINVFAPNQSRLGMDVGDCPATINTVTTPHVYRSIRPLFLPRPDRQSRFGIFYYSSTAERDRILQAIAIVTNIRNSGINDEISSSEESDGYESDESESDVNNDVREEDNVQVLDDGGGVDEDDRSRRPTGRVEGGMNPSRDSSFSSLATVSSIDSLFEEKISTFCSYDESTVCPYDRQIPAGNDRNKPFRLTRLTLPATPPVIDTDTSSDDDDGGDGDNADDGEESEADGI